MKNSTKYYLFAVLLVASSMVVQGQQSPYNTLNAIPICWTTGGGVDSSLYATQIDASGRTTPNRIYYYNAAGSAVSVAGGVMRFGHCSNPSNDTVVVQINAILDSLGVLITNTTEPQQCTCTYTLDLDNHAFSVLPNAQYPTWSYDRFVVRNCGAGNEEVFRQGGSSLATSKASTYYQGISAIQNGGVLDSVRIYTKNPDSVVWIYLSPAKVAQNYPILLSSSAVDTADLRYNSASVADMNNALEVVMAYGLNRAAITHSPPLPYPTFDFSAELNASGNVVLRFYVFNQPTGFYAGIANTAGSRRLDYHPTASGSLVQSNGSGIVGINHSIAGSYNTCDTTIITSYNATMVQTNDMNWYTLVVDDPPVPALSAGPGTATCTQACPEQPQCIEICNDVGSPVPVTIVSNQSECQVTGIVDFPDPVSSIYQIPANTINSITIGVVVGPVSITVVNGSSVKTRSFPTGATFSARAPGECSFLQTAFSIDATASGAVVLVSTSK